MDDIRERDKTDMAPNRRPFLIPLVRVSAAFTIVFSSAAAIYLLMGLSALSTAMLLLVGAVTILVLVLSAPAMIISHHRAREVTGAQIPRIERIVSDLSTQFHVSKPKIMLIPSQDPNACAFGFGRRSYVGVTEGLFALLDDNELRAVVAHEFAHIWSRDSATQTLGIAVKKTLVALGVLLAILIVIAGMVVVAVLLSLAGSKSKSAARGLMVVPMVMAFGVYLLSPVIIGISYFFFSRKAELRADFYSAQITRRPADLARALARIDEVPHNGLGAGKKKVYSSLWIAVDKDAGLLGRLLSSHPSVEERIRRLMEMDGVLGKRSDASAVRLADSMYHRHQVRTLRHWDVAGELRCEECNIIIALDPTPLRYGTLICPTCGQTIPPGQIYARLKVASPEPTLRRPSRRTRNRARPLLPCFQPFLPYCLFLRSRNSLEGAYSEQSLTK